MQKFLTAAKKHRQILDDKCCAMSEKSATIPRKNSAKKEVRNGTVKQRITGHSSASGDHKMANGSANGKSASAEEAIESVENDEEFEAATSYVDVFTIGGYVTLQLFGYLRDFLRRWKVERSLVAQEKGNEGFVPLYRWVDQIRDFSTLLTIGQRLFTLRNVSISFITEVYRKAATVLTIEVKSQVFLLISEYCSQSINQSIDRPNRLQTRVQNTFMQFSHGRRALESFNLHCAIFCRYIF